MALYIKTAAGSLYPQVEHPGWVTLPTDVLVEIADDAIKPYVKPTLESVILEWWHSSDGPDELSAAIREAFPEAGL